MKRLLVVIAVVAMSLSLAFSASAEIQKAKGSVELTDPAGDITNINTSDGPVPGFDVIKLDIVSDGKLLKFIATLKEPSGSFASSVLRIYIDTDNNPDTGLEKLMFFEGKKGYNYESNLSACIEFDNRVTVCSGGTSKDAKVVERFAAMNLEKFKGRNTSEVEFIVSSFGSSGEAKAIRTPIKGKVLEGALRYKDLGVKSGQTILILVEESSAPLFEPKKKLFPDVELTLK